jgi:hypothetical protein
MPELGAVQGGPAGRVTRRVEGGDSDCEGGALGWAHAGPTARPGLPRAGLLGKPYKAAPLDSILRRDPRDWTLGTGICSG